MTFQRAGGDGEGESSRRRERLRGGGDHLGALRFLKIRRGILHIDSEVKPEEMRITIGQDLAVTHNYENGENTNVRGPPAKVSIRATNLFPKEDRKWKMIGHYADLLPHLEK